MSWIILEKKTLKAKEYFVFYLANRIIFFSINVFPFQQIFLISYFFLNSEENSCWKVKNCNILLYRRFAILKTNSKASKISIHPIQKHEPGNSDTNLFLFSFGFFVIYYFFFIFYFFMPKSVFIWLILNCWMIIKLMTLFLIFANKRWK